MQAQSTGASSQTISAAAVAAAGSRAPMTSTSARIAMRSAAARSRSAKPARQSSAQLVTEGAAFKASCPNHGSTSSPGCGSWNAGPSSGQAPGFAAGQPSSPDLLTVIQDPWSGGQGPHVLTASSFQDWPVTATDQDPSNAPGEVLTYPDASLTVTSPTTA